MPKLLEVMDLGHIYQCVPWLGCWHSQHHRTGCVQKLTDFSYPEKSREISRMENFSSRRNLFSFPQHLCIEVISYLISSSNSSDNRPKQCGHCFGNSRLWQPYRGDTIGARGFFPSSYPQNFWSKKLTFTTFSILP